MQQNTNHARLAAILALAVPGELSQQARLIGKHLLDHGSITGVEAAAVYRCRHLPRRIADLRAWQVEITTTLRKDATGQRYARYALGA